MAELLPAALRRVPRTVWTLVLFAAAAGVPYAAPSFERYRILRPGELEQAVSLRGRVPVVQWLEPEPATRAPEVPPAAGSVPPTAGGEAKRTEAPGLAPPASRRIEIPLEVAEVGLVDETGAMNAFFARLLRTERREPAAVTRISHFGDSPLTGDLISGEARTRLQAAYGDAGHGFILAGRPWGWYGHDGVVLSASKWKSMSPLLVPGDGGFNGLGAVSFAGPAASRTEIRLEKGGFSRIEVSDLVRPGGGHFSVAVDGEPPAEAGTDGPGKKEGVFSLRLGKEARRVVLAGRGDGPVSLHGVVLEREGPGIVYDALGANGAAVHMLTLLDAGGWVQALAARHSDLVILSYGTNESGYDGIPGPRYRLDWIEVIGRIRRALPGASILIMAPMDRGMRREDGAVVTMPTIPLIVEAQRQIAAETGCAFFDTYTAMGGEGTMARWYGREPRLVSGDFTHTTKGGSDRVARLLVGAIEEAYRGWLEENGAPAPGAAPNGEGPEAPRAGGGAGRPDEASR
jgi:lysophospholipase L1-like esterase